MTTDFPRPTRDPVPRAGDFPPFVTLAFRNAVATLILVWLAALVGYVSAIPFFLLSHGDAFAYAWTGGAVPPDELEAYRWARDLVCLMGAFSGLAIAQVTFILSPLSGKDPSD